MLPRPCLNHQFWELQSGTFLNANQISFPLFTPVVTGRAHRIWLHRERRSRAGGGRNRESVFPRCRISAGARCGGSHL
jgi:hypothetical protein